jgi:hypothetical protein
MMTANVKRVELGMLLPGITVNTNPASRITIQADADVRFNSEPWERFGPIIGGAIGGR